MQSIFISYRRGDSATISGRIYDELRTYFGQQAVFKDVDAIPMGAPFPQHINMVLQNCGVAVVVIGPQWLTITDSQGRRRLDDPGDFVRIEIETALRNGLLVIPVLVEGATMPPMNLLPPTLRPLVQLNGTQVRNDPDFHNDMQRLIRVVENYLINRGMQPAGGAPGGYPQTGMVPVPNANAYRPPDYRRWTILGVVAAVLFFPVIFGLGYVITHVVNNGNSPEQGVQNTISDFCGAMRAKNYTQAHNDLSANYQSQVSVSQMPGIVQTFSETPDVVTDCSEFGSGGFFTSTNATTASDNVQFNVHYPSGVFADGQVSKTVVFVQESGAWKIDSIEG